MPVLLHKIWVSVATRVGLRKSGAVKLRHDVRTCEYDDVHVLWNMIKKNETQRLGGSGTKKRRFWNIRRWAKRVPKICRGNRSI